MLLNSGTNLNDESKLPCLHDDYLDLMLIICYTIQFGTAPRVKKSKEHMMLIICYTIQFGTAPRVKKSKEHMMLIICYTILFGTIWNHITMNKGVMNVVHFGALLVYTKLVVVDEWC
ncbi:hypothetical protein ACJX0J_024170, partial [Zea mays]